MLKRELDKTHATAFRHALQHPTSEEIEDFKIYWDERGNESLVSKNGSVAHTADGRAIETSMASEPVQ